MHVEKINMDYRLLLLCKTLCQFVFHLSAELKEDYFLFENSTIGK